MKKTIFFILLIFQSLNAQDREVLLEGLFEEKIEEEQQLLPQKMVFTQSLFWGENGL